MQTNTTGFACLDQTQQGWGRGELTVITTGPRRIRRLPHRERFFESLDDG
ncbi:MAG TPA: hypothetical protein H9899_07240 [Candidatus Sphingomonas excrementigallinarum]|nr:hypothetical protein [Candidatus Sphingomonas excrementigallinarum]